LFEISQSGGFGQVSPKYHRCPVSPRWATTRSWSQA
jgi:hypothetical protein